MESPVTETTLVKHTPREKIFLKIDERRKKRQEEWEKQHEIMRGQRVSEEESLKKLAKKSPEEFYKMVFLREFECRRTYDDMCITLEELYEYSDAELGAFEEAVFLEVRSIFGKDISAMLFIPIFGWAFGIGFLFAYFFGCKNNRQFDEYHYLKYRKIARKKGIFLASVIREYAEEKIKKLYDTSDACML